MAARINEVFDILDLVVRRLPVLNQLVVEIILLGLVIIGARALFKRHP